MDELGADFVVVTPAFPENGRTIFKGHLFVGDLLLSDSPMKHHPLTPMTDANLVRVMQAQLDPARGRRVGLVDYRVVAQGAEAIGRRIDGAARRGRGHGRRRWLERRRPARAGPRRREAAAGGGRLGAGHRHPGAARPAARCPRRAAAAGRRRARGGLGQLLGRHQRAGGRLPGGRRRRLRHRPAAAGRGPRPGGRGAGLGAAAAGRCAGAGLCHRRARRGARGAAAAGRRSAPARWWNRRCRASRWAWSKPASAS